MNLYDYYYYFKVVKTLFFVSLSIYLDFVFYCVSLFKVSIPFWVFYITYFYGVVSVVMVDFAGYLLLRFEFYIIVIFSNFFYVIITQYMVAYYVTDFLMVCWYMWIWFSFSFFKLVFVVVGAFGVLIIFFALFPYSVTGFVFMYFSSVIAENFHQNIGLFIWQLAESYDPTEADEHLEEGEEPEPEDLEVMAEDEPEVWGGSTWGEIVTTYLPSFNAYTPVRIHGHSTVDMFGPGFFIFLVSFLIVGAMFLGITMVLFYIFICFYIAKFVIFKAFLFFAFYAFCSFIYIVPVLSVNFLVITVLRCFYAALVAELVWLCFDAIKSLIFESSWFARLNGYVVLGVVLAFHELKAYKLALQEYWEWEAVDAFTDGSEWLHGEYPAPVNRVTDW